MDDPRRQRAGPRVRLLALALTVSALAAPILGCAPGARPPRAADGCRRHPAGPASLTLRTAGLALTRRTLAGPRRTLAATVVAATGRTTATAAAMAPALPAATTRRPPLPMHAGRATTLVLAPPIRP